MDSFNDLASSHRKHVKPASVAESPSPLIVERFDVVKSPALPEETKGGKMRPTASQELRHHGYTENDNNEDFFD